MQVFTNETTNTSSDPYAHKGGRLLIWVYGTFGGGLVSLEIQAPDGTWMPAENGVWSEALCRMPDLPAASIRLTISGSTGASLSAAIGGGAG